MNPKMVMNESIRKVLLVEHDANDRRILRNWLLADRCEVFEAADLITTLGACSRFQPDLILLELRLPGTGGLEVMRRIKADPALQSIPVILLSAAATTTERVQGLDGGAVDFVSKPFDPTEFQARVRAALRTRYLQELLEQRAHIDGLTGLANRHALHERLNQTWEQGKRSGSPLALIFADLDHFKRINDRYGHAAGDDVLCRASQLLKRTVRAADFVARYGGEELVVAAPSCTLEGALDIAERFRQGVERFEIESHKSKIAATCSLGVSIIDNYSKSDVNQLLQRADQALYAAKSAGRNAVWFWDPRAEAPSPHLVPKPTESQPESVRLEIVV